MARKPSKIKRPRKKLYVASMTVKVAVYASNPLKALALARRHAAAELEFAGYEVKEGKSGDDVPEDWNDAVPYGCKRGKTCKELLDEVRLRREREEARIQPRLF
jgi:hypothetical protein